MLNLPKYKILALSKLKAFADDKSKKAELQEVVLDRTENIVGKGENAGNKYFLSFHTIFQKAAF